MSRPSRLYCALHLPWLAEDGWRREHPHAAPDAPRVFAEKVDNAMRLTALGRAAALLGLAPGITLADARAREPTLVVLDRNHAAEARLLARIAAGLARYTPMAAAAPPDGAMLDITGCAAPYAGGEGLAADLVARLAAGGLFARAALGETPEQARALARFGRRADATAPQPPQLRSLPVEALEASPEVTIALRRAGLKTIGHLAIRPRAMLAARFGDLALRLARLLGEEDRHFTPERPLPPVSAVRRFAEPIGRIADALACLEELGRAAARTLLKRHQGGRRFEARFFRSDGAVACVAIGTGRPTRDPALLIRLFRERVDALADPIDPGFGFDCIRLDVHACEPLAAAQADHLARERESEALDALVDRLAARLGPARIRRMAPCDTHIPECAATPVPPAATPAWEPPPEHEPPLRPVRLLDPPQPIAASHSEVPDGAPHRFTWRGRVHRVVRWEGPERIAAEWWRRRDRAGRTRDYYRVEDEAGRRFWLFRHGLHERTEKGGEPVWYLQGLFA